MLLVFSFLNVTMFTDYANAEGDNGEATEFAEPVGEPEAQAQPEDEANGPESEGSYPPSANMQKNRIIYYYSVQKWSIVFAF